ncbi:MAG: endolytic transglycosylase MltG [Chloroflexi bacterium]|nr:endolytic transglycosylase MltG [Chloroflexota bacterium]
MADFLREDLGDALTTPASSDSTEVEFAIGAGETASGIAARLASDGLLLDERAFLLIAVEKELDGALQAGSYLLRRNLTPEQLVATLLEAKDPSIVLRFRTGLRLEQITAYLQARPPEIATLQLDAEEFLDLVRQPPAALLADYPWLDLPEGATLEGYLAAGDYRVLPDTTPDELVRKLLDRFIATVGEERLQAARDAGVSFNEVLALASIVEKETRLDDERALVAGVYRNRIERGMLLNADPTVIWGVDLMSLGETSLDAWPDYSFWNVPEAPLASIDFPAEIAGYQTYQVAGLIPGPICTPTVASIDAALGPDTRKGYLYFVAVPDGDGKHDFSKTYEQHLAKLREYGYIK